MTCKTAKARLMALLDGELTERAQASLETHLSACQECQQERAKLAETLHHSDAWKVEADNDIVSAVLSEIEGAGLQEFLREMQALRTEVRHLRAEVAELRSQRRDSEAWKRPPVLIPTATRTALPINLV